MAGRGGAARRRSWPAAAAIGRTAVINRLRVMIDHPSNKDMVDIVNSCILIWSWWQESSFTVVRPPPRVSHILSAFPEFSNFNTLLSSTSLPSDLSNRSSLTLLAVLNHLLRRQPPFPPESLRDSLRFNVLLQFLSLSNLLFPPHLFTSLRR
ncbi:hypothetical protein Scep_010544 [Stephania cephalantha]|uniref:FAS1 domain-containing protein n=1 Tax=Stephania cephalantha TaxID=152367 RepID=A0AAP0JV92_9MAGN